MHSATRSHVLMIWMVVTLLTSSAAIMIRFCEIPASSVGFWRVFGAAIVLSPWCWAAWRREGRPRLFDRGACLAGLFLGVHFATWAWAVQHTQIANAMLFIGLQPLMAPFLARPLLGERLNRWELAGALTACAGMSWIVWRQLTLDREELPGTLVALGSAFLCACYFVITRKYRRNRHAMLFTVPAYATAAAVQAIIGVAVDGRIEAGRGGSLLALAGLILLPTVGGHSLAIYLLRHAKSQLITLSVPTQFVIGTIAAVFILGERPSTWFFPGAALVMAGVVVGVVKGTAGTPKRP